MLSNFESLRLIFLGKKEGKVKFITTEIKILFTKKNTNEASFVIKDTKKMQRNKKIFNLYC